MSFLFLVIVMNYDMILWYGYKRKQFFFLFQEKRNNIQVICSKPYIMYMRCLLYIKTNDARYFLCCDIKNVLRSHQHGEKLNVKTFYDIKYPLSLFLGKIVNFLK